MKRAIKSYARTYSFAKMILNDRKTCSRGRGSDAVRLVKRMTVRAERAVGRAIIRGGEE